MIGNNVSHSRRRVKREFAPNLKTKKFWSEEENRFVTLKVSCRGMKTIYTGTVALDLGASTGGFTDVLLQNGAAKVFAVDVGHGQLHEKLRQDPRVVSLEGVNARELSKELVPEPIDLLVADVSFISLTKVLPPCAPLLKPMAWAIVLVKPQFEAGRQNIGSGGVVRDEVVRKRCVEQIVDFAADKLRWSHIGHLPSPILGPNGNQEFLAAFRTADTI